MQLKISVIIAIYNVEKYLEQMLESIFLQTYRNIEVIMVNDGSEDSSGILCDKYSKIDSRFICIHQINKGLVEARKTGVKNATGDYLLFVDGDDYIDKEYIEKLVNVVQKNNYPDVVVTGYKEVTVEDTRIVVQNAVSGKYIGESLEELKQKALFTGNFYSQGITPAVWNKLFKSSFFREVGINVDSRITMGEDVALSYPLMSHAQSIIVDNSICSYNYRIVNNSMSRRIDSQYFLKINILYKELCRDINGVMKESIDYYYIFVFLYGIKNLINQYKGFRYTLRGIRCAVQDSEIKKIITEKKIKYDIDDEIVIEGIIRDKLELAFIRLLLLKVVRKVREMLIG